MFNVKSGIIKVMIKNRVLWIYKKNRYQLLLYKTQLPQKCNRDSNKVKRIVMR